MNKNKGSLDFNEVIDELMKNSAYQGHFSSRDEFKKALLVLKQILPDWLVPVYMPDRVLLKLKRGTGLQLFDINARI